jgi:hypothetical protein
MDSLPFGKHRGVPIDSVPTDYLTWFLANMQALRPATRMMVEAALARRSAGTWADPGPTERPRSKPPTERSPKAEPSTDLTCPACGVRLFITLSDIAPGDDAVPF